MKNGMLTNEETGSVCMALAHLIHAGISTADALVLLKEDETDPACRAVLAAMADRADSGASLSVAFQEAACFPVYVCTLLDVGERVGRLEQTLMALARYYRDRAQLERRLSAALLYPAVLLAVLLVVLLVLLVWVLPVFDDVYAQLGSQLTGIAGGLLALGGFLRKFLPALAVLLVLTGSGAAIPGLRRRLIAFCKGKLGDKGVLGLINTARFIQALSLGQSSGMTAQEAVMLASSLAHAPRFQQRCACCLARLDAGDSLQQALRQAKLLPHGECRLLDAGVRSGRGEAVLEDIAARLLEESEAALEQAVGKIEPAIVAVACGLVGVVILSVMLPLMQIMTAIG